MCETSTTSKAYTAAMEVLEKKGIIVTQEVRREIIDAIRNSIEPKKKHAIPSGISFTFKEKIKIVNSLGQGIYIKVTEHPLDCYEFEIE